MKRFAVLAGLLLATPALAEDPQWRSFDFLAAGDRQVAETALFDIFGDNTELWPDWIEPRAVVIPTGRNNSLLLVRYPLHLPCGEFSIVVFGMVENGQRARLGDRFCAGDLTVFQTLQPMPDLQFSDEGVQTERGDWDYKSIRWRWTPAGWSSFAPK